MVREPDEREEREARDEPEERRERRPPREPRDEESEHRPWGARVLAPVAFFTAVVVLVLLVNNSLSGEAERSPSAAPAVTPTGETTTTGSATTVPRAERQFYRIQTGDTLEAIALRFDTTVDDLLQLNPGIDANSLTPGQRIRIK